MHDFKWHGVLRAAPGARCPKPLPRARLSIALDANDLRNQNAFWLGANLVVEIVSPDDVERNTVIKRTDYAAASIPEYWIVHPAEGTITVLRLTGDTYVVHGVFHRGDTATSSLLQGFTVSVEVVCDAE